MFNWFRRKVNKTDSEPVSEPTEQVTTPETETPSQETTSDDYLSWAKNAYKNIQQRQTPSTSPTETPEKEVSPDSEPLPQQESQSPATEAKEETPAWMQKSDRLEALKETALETATVEETAPLTFDEEFVWSAKVLAAQGRAPDDISEEEINWLKRLRQGLGKSRRGLVNQLKSIVGQGPLNEDAVMEIEALLLQADTGIEATDQIISTLQNKLLEEALPSEQALEYLKSILREILDRPLQKVVNPGFAPEKGVLNIWLLTGVNGAGKTTTIGKLAHLAQQSGYDCIIAAADTFRAAAVEQVKVWGERTNTPVIANPGKNTDPAAVVFDGISAAQAREADLLLVDTAGRLQNKKNLMAELAKIRRIIDKKAANAQIESLLVLDATLGQNGLRQAAVFSEAANLSGVVLTKLDGTAKGGVALAVAQQLDLPIRFIGVGEGIEDLRPFSSYEFVEALLNE
ncbi:MAG: signal recognition particle-docking protein FtsY [Crocosphaera sp.]|nr:signal recognition particle-docking protein FtsY [Crocosphaera sp.]